MKVSLQGDRIVFTVDNTTTFSRAIKESDKTDFPDAFPDEESKPKPRAKPKAKPKPRAKPTASEKTPEQDDKAGSVDEPEENSGSGE